MSELKPVAWMWEYRGFAMVTANEAKAMELQEDQEIELTPLYAMPSGFALVPAGLIEDAASDNMNRSLLWRNNVINAFADIFRAQEAGDE